MENSGCKIIMEILEEWGNISIIFPPGLSIEKCEVIPVGGDGPTALGNTIDVLQSSETGYRHAHFMTE